MLPWLLAVPVCPGFRDALIIVLTTGFSIGGFTALILNLILPFDADDVDELAVDPHAAYVPYKTVLSCTQ